MQYIFGPVQSRRLGLSLGIDPVQDRTCTLDCVYCQLGATSRKVLERQVYVPAEAVVREVRTAIAAGTDMDCITFSGTGEPTLNLKLGSMIAKIKALSHVPVAVITNSTLLHRQDVRADVLQADLVVPTLSTVKAQVFARLNRPHPGISLEQVLGGLQLFSREYTGRLWIEVMLVQGINDSPEDLQALADFLKDLPGEKIQINTVTRPPAESDCAAVRRQTLEQALRLFGPRAEIIDAHSRTCRTSADADPHERICALVRSHPCTLEHICDTLGLSRLPAETALQELLDKQTIQAVRHGSRTFYRASGR